MPRDLHQDPLPIAQDALERSGDVPAEDVVFLARSLFEVHAKIDRLYAALEKRADWTRELVDQVLQETTPTDASALLLRQRLRETLDRVPVFEEHPDQRRLDWLAAWEDRLLDARGRVNNENVSLREAIDWLMKHQEKP